MFYLKYLKALLQALNADVSPSEVAAGFALGAVMGLVPKSNLLAYFLLFLIFIFRVNGSMALLGAFLFAILGSFTDPWAERFGYWLLTGLPAFGGAWTALYNLPIVPWTAFNDSLVLGNLAIGLILALPLFFASRWFVVVYRARYRERILKWKVMQALKTSSFYQWYERLRGS